jgi:hypothetical protein
MFARRVGGGSERNLNYVWLSDAFGNIPAVSDHSGIYLDFASGWRGVQSFGGNATRQNVGLGSMNSTPT